ncbi:molybdenum cofactor cytidylyltransferase [Intestinirhabdus alba]|jgi:molybdenum cofactor cytidylyltransferase|uniref:Molybdenum cofactor cytidylyltransferase n=1 Tax=Intestinirhabdus alba TaxID=2899544 RepID=A0A6L6ISL2_9ENTR|nr:molybdenum cofactor cytidylyltransferase [Intestinirhabdus alba]MTH48366.1 molybdenum cofactor cytidylyltransferase [Intestinirhabdus alba]
MKQIDCIITAAGLSSRMGQWKMMLPWQGGTILDASIKNALQFCSRIILVTGFRGEALRQRYGGHPQITLVHNAEYQQGLFSSVRAGARRVTSEHCFITHGDLPCLHPAIFRTLWPLRDAGAILPQYQGTPGHPILVASAHLQRLLRQSHAASVRKLLLSDRHRFLEMNYPEIIFDIDTPADFIRLGEKQASRSG